MSTDYRKLYNEIATDRHVVDDLLREYGVEARGSDSRQVGLESAVVCAHARIMELEERIEKLETHSHFHYQGETAS